MGSLSAQGIIGRGEGEAATLGRSRLRHTWAAQGLPLYQRIQTWLLFWPVLVLFARQQVYFAGPARSAFEYQSGVGTASSKLPFYVTFVLLWGIVLSRRIATLQVLRNNPLILAQLVLAFVSASWADPGVASLEMTLQLILFTLFACYLTIRMPVQELMRFFIFMGTAASILSILFVFALPGYGLFAGYAGGAWNGICDHKNTLGVSALGLLLPVFFVEGYTRNKRLLYIALMLLLVIKSQSRGAWLYAIGVLTFISWMHAARRLRRHEALLLWITALALAVIAVTIFVTYIDSIARLLGKDPSGSGRTGIYAEVLISVMKRPWLGYGYGAFWRGSAKESYRIGLTLNWPNIAYSESGVLEIALQLGWVGVVLVLAPIARAIYQGLRLLRSQFYRPQVGWYLSLLVLEALVNLDAGWLLVPASQDWVLILIAIIGLNHETKRARRAKDAPRVPSRIPQTAATYS